MSKRIILKKAVAQNFKCFSEATIDFHNRTLVQARNGKGKTTISDMEKWVLFNIGGSDVRPHDKDNNPISNEDIRVELTYTVDGQEIVLEKIQKQQFVKGVFTGNKNFFAINGIPYKSEKAFKEFLSQNFYDVQSYLFLTRSSEFFSLSVEEKRKLLTERCSTITDEQVIASNSRFAGLQHLLSDGVTVEQIILKCRNDDKKYQERMKTIPLLIQASENRRNATDVAELELQKNALKEQIDDISKQIDKYKANEKERLEKAEKVLELKFKLSDLQNKANQEIDTDRNALKHNISEAEFTIKHSENDIAELTGKKTGLENHIVLNQGKIAANTSNIEEIANRSIDMSEMICPVCKREYTEDRKKELQLALEQDKKAKISELNSANDEMHSEINEHKAKIEILDSKIKSSKAVINRMQSLLVEYNEQLKALPDIADITGTDDYKAIQSELETCEIVKNSTNYEELYSEKEQLVAELLQVEHKIATANNNSEIDEEIAKLREEQKILRQNLANNEKERQLVSDFRRAKAELLQAEVNKNFSVVKWKLFEDTIAGDEPKNCCEAIVNGSEYNSQLNTGDRLLANVDILYSLQKFADVRLPIFIDDKESIDSDRIPVLDTQMILLERADVDEITIKEI